MVGRLKVYLAGPEGLLVGGRAIDLQKESLCATYGFECLLLDKRTFEAAPSDAGMIYAKCLSLMLRADFGIFNLTPVAGTAPDSSTIFELGMMAALGKPVYAYLNQDQDSLQRSVTLGELVDNSIIVSCFTMQNRAMVRTAVAAKSRFSDLSGLESCLAAASWEFSSATNDSSFADGSV